MKYNVLVGFLIVSSLLTSCTGDVFNIDSNCYIELKKTGLIENIKGVMIENNGSFYISSGENIRYSTCDLPTQFLRSGIKVKFNAYTHEINPDDLYYAYPISLVSIAKINN